MLRPRHKAGLDATWQASDALLLDLGLLYVGPRRDVGRESFAPVKAGGYVTADVAATWTFSPDLALYGRVENLFDRRYQDPDGFLRPGIGAYAGIRASL